LKDEIAIGKVTPRWIEECLDKEYKRPYTLSKSEHSSLSKHQSQQQMTLIAKTSDGKDCAMQKPEENMTKDVDDEDYAYNSCSAQDSDIGGGEEEQYQEDDNSAVAEMVVSDKCENNNKHNYNKVAINDGQQHAIPQTHLLEFEVDYEGAKLRIRCELVLTTYEVVNAQVVKNFDHS
jgi:hypothetical protein